MEKGFRFEKGTCSGKGSRFAHSGKGPRFKKGIHSEKGSRSEKGNRQEKGYLQLILSSSGAQICSGFAYPVHAINALGSLSVSLLDYSFHYKLVHANPLTIKETLPGSIDTKRYKI